MNTTAAAADKQAVRDDIYARRRQLMPEWTTQKSRTISERLLELPQFYDADTICLYLALPHEVSLAHALKTALADGRRILVPAYRPVSNDYAFKQITAATPLKNGLWNVPEPDTTDWTTPTGNTLIAVPGVAFDPAGRRLGHGKGFYDRLLAAVSPTSKCFKAGICFEFQIRDSLPAEPWDINMDAVLTDLAIYSTTAGTTETLSKPDIIK